MDLDGAAVSFTPFVIFKTKKKDKEEAVFNFIFISKAAWYFRGEQDDDDQLAWIRVLPLRENTLFPEKKKNHQKIPEPKLINNIR